MTTTTYSEAWLQGPQSTQFYTRTYTPQSGTAKAAIVFTHGFADHVARYSKFHTKLAENGLQIFAFDQRGFGRTAMDTEGHKSPHSAYGKTCWNDQMTDIVWAIDHVRKSIPSVPVFLMGHSMGGGEVLGFATQSKDSPHYAKVASLSGVIATSPLILLTKPAAKPLRMIGSLMGKVAPNMSFPADVDPSALSHDPSVGEDYLKDPFTRQHGTLRGLDDMLSKGEQLLESRHVNWQDNIPMLICHGTADRVTSYTATESFYKKITARDKKLASFTDGYHELHNEPDGVLDKLINEVVVFVMAHTPTTTEDVKSKM
ncbi:hypothetical protein AMATHDRAFT_140634 [Amanita thiersii Skay4041]|uniref:Serine aminopeptidase S33 domain-containing protein n=1 Tax=Amanita thiersii Skay4041 TaxID=703135 RepID=A0A2A9NPY5_9AGAR|nr:hypothetical protein AMATHDRAFT_140634 [Amanita thiersii Skay4041]